MIFENGEGATEKNIDFALLRRHHRCLFLHERLRACPAPSAIAFAGIAVLVSSNTSNTEVGNGLINVVVMPMMVLSGIFFSYHNFPDWSIPVIQRLPLTMLTDSIRSVFNEGAGFHEAIMPILILTATGALFFSAGLKIFKWH